MGHLNHAMFVVKLEGKFGQGPRWHLLLPLGLGVGLCHVCSVAVILTLTRTLIPTLTRILTTVALPSAEARRSAYTHS